MDTPNTPKPDGRSPYERDPGAGRPDDERLEQAPPTPADNDADPDTLPASTRTGRTSRGEYATDPATGAGGYRDHTGTFTTEPVDQPGEEPIDPIDPQL